MNRNFVVETPIVETETGEIVELFESHFVAQRIMDAMNKRAKENGLLSHAAPGHAPFELLPARRVTPMTARHFANRRRDRVARFLAL